MNYLDIILVLSVLLILQEVIHQVTLHRLVNKLMSHSFYDYQVSKKFKMKEKKEDPPTIDNQENFATLDDIHPL